MPRSGCGWLLAGFLITLAVRTSRLMAFYSALTVRSSCGIVWRGGGVVRVDCSQLLSPQPRSSATGKSDQRVALNVGPDKQGPIGGTFDVSDLSELECRRVDGLTLKNIAQSSTFHQTRHQP